MFRDTLRATGLCVALCAGSAAFAQAPAPDPALPQLNSCLTGPATSGEQAFMTALNPALNAPDRVAWCLFVYVNSQASTSGNNNALFETWASDDDTFQPNPQWPTATTVAKPLRAPILPHLARQARAGTLTPFVLPFQSGPQCPQGQLCIGEEVRRNFATFDFIKKNNLFTRDGLKAFTQTITFPSDSIEV